MATAPKPQPASNVEDENERVKKIRTELVDEDDTADPSGGVQSGVDTPITK